MLGTVSRSATHTYGVGLLSWTPAAVGGGMEAKRSHGEEVVHRDNLAVL